MSTGKYARRAAATLALATCSFVFVTAADKGEAPRSSASGPANSVVVESQTLMIGIPGSVVGVSISNSTGIAGLVVPLEIRPVTAGTSIAQTIVYQMNPTGRMANSPLGYADTSVDSLWPEASRVDRQSCVICSVSCSGPVSNSYCVADAGCSNPTSPYGLFFGTVSTGDPQQGELITLEPGADPGPSADASLQIILTQIGPTPGFFDIDTCCWKPSNSIAYVEPFGNLIVPSFTKGVIELRCDCSCQGDPFCDGITNIQDVVNTIDIAFRGEAPGVQPFCPYVPADPNCDGIVNIQDVVIMVEVAFRGGDPDVLFCDACTI